MHSKQNYQQFGKRWNPPVQEKRRASKEALEPLIQEKKRASDEALALVQGRSMRDVSSPKTSNKTVSRSICAQCCCSRTKSQVNKAHFVGN
jgi:putative sterol carrier protein